MYMPSRSRHLEEMEKTLLRINNEWNLMVESRKKLLSEGKHAGPLFVVRVS